MTIARILSCIRLRPTNQRGASERPTGEDRSSCAGLRTSMETTGRAAQPERRRSLFILAAIVAAMAMVIAGESMANAETSFHFEHYDFEHTGGDGYITISANPPLDCSEAYECLGTLEHNNGFSAGFSPFVGNPWYGGQLGVGENATASLESGDIAILHRNGEVARATYDGQPTIAEPKCAGSSFSGTLGANASAVAAFRDMPGLPLEAASLTQGPGTYTATFLNTATQPYYEWIRSEAHPVPGVKVEVETIHYCEGAVAPTVTQTSPTTGHDFGGTTVTITGANFTGATAVKFGATDAAGFVVNKSGTKITAGSPGGTGAGDVTVTTAGGTSATSPADQFTYVVTDVDNDGVVDGTDQCPEVAGPAPTGCPPEFEANCDVYWAKPGTTLSVPASAGVLVNDKEPGGSSFTPEVDHISFGVSSHPYSVDSAGALTFSPGKSTMPREAVINYHDINAAGVASNQTTVTIIIQSEEPSSARLTACAEEADLQAPASLMAMSAGLQPKLPAEGWRPRFYCSQQYRDAVPSHVDVWVKGQIWKHGDHVDKVEASTKVETREPEGTNKWGKYVNAEPSPPVFVASGKFTVSDDYLKWSLGRPEPSAYTYSDNGGIVHQYKFVLNATWGRNGSWSGWRRDHKEKAGPYYCPGAHFQQQ